MKVINVEGAHSHCDIVSFKYDDNGWSEAFALIESAVDSFGDDIGDEVTIKVSIVNMSQKDFEELIPANEF